MSKFENFDYEYFDKWPVVLNILELVLTQKCNLACPHCMRGPARNKDMDPEVLDAVFQKIKVAERVCLGGGDVSLAPEMIRKVVASMRKNHAIVHSFTLPTNGIVLTDELIDALNEAKAYTLESTGGTVPPFFQYPPVQIDISIDDFHIDQMKKQNIDLDILRKNIHRYAQEFGEDSVIFSSATDYNIIDEGNAKGLETSVTKSPFVTDYEFPFYVDYVPEKQKGLIFLKGVLTVSADGKVIPTSCSFDDEKKYSVGNVKELSLSQIMSRLNARQYGESDVFFAFNKLFLGLAAPQELREEYNKSEKKKQKTEAFNQTKLYGAPIEKE